MEILTVKSQNTKPSEAEWKKNTFLACVLLLTQADRGLEPQAWHTIFLGSLLKGKGAGLLPRAGRLPVCDLLGTIDWGHYDAPPWDKFSTSNYFSKRTLLSFYSD